MKPKKILIIEDDLAMREIVTHKLLSRDFLVKQAESGDKGLDLIEKEKPDLVLLDLMLPGMDGFQVLEALRKKEDKKLSQTPVIVLTNLWSNNDILRARALSVTDYLVKAYFTPEEILEKVEGVFQK